MAQNVIRENCPEHLDDFISAFDKLQTPEDFVAVKLKEAVFDDEKLKAARQIINNLSTKELEDHEFLRLGRRIVHNHPFFNELQIELCKMVSEVAGEPLEPCYNFLSLYNDLGVLEPHLDGPDAMWTLDVCIEQSEPWPIHFSQVRPWPGPDQYKGKDWQEQVKNDPNNVFAFQSLDPGEGMVFSGNSQWHYRNRIGNKHKKNFCYLIFFHYIPKGTQDLVYPKKWAEKFNLPILEQLHFS